VNFPLAIRLPLLQYEGRRTGTEARWIFVPGSLARKELPDDLAIPRFPFVRHSPLSAAGAIADRRSGRQGN
jgi:hypothetical protein